MRATASILFDSMVLKAFLVGGNHAVDRLVSVKYRWVVFEGPEASKKRPQGLRYNGLPMTLCALWTGNLAITGSSLVDWSSPLKTFQLMDGKTLYLSLKAEHRAKMR